MDVSQKSRLEAELLKIGIKTEADLREAITRLPALPIGIMVDPIRVKTRKGTGIYGRSGQQNLCG